MSLLVRAVGLGLEQFEVDGVLPDPTLVVRRSLPGGRDKTIAGNDDWMDSASLPAFEQATTSTQAFPLANGSADAALVLALNPGVCTVVLSEAHGEIGVALVELCRVGVD